MILQELQVMHFTPFKLLGRNLITLLFWEKLSLKLLAILQSREKKSISKHVMALFDVEFLFVFFSVPRSS